MKEADYEELKRLAIPYSDRYTNVTDPGRYGGPCLSAVCEIIQRVVTTNGASGKPIEIQLVSSTRIDWAAYLEGCPRLEGRGFAPDEAASELLLKLLRHLTTKGAS